MSWFENGPDQVMLFPTSDDSIDAVEERKDLAAFAKAKGCREEYEDYWIFIGIEMSDVQTLQDRSPRPSSPWENEDD